MHINVHPHIITSLFAFILALFIASCIVGIAQTKYTGTTRTSAYADFEVSLSAWQYCVTTTYREITLTSTSCESLNVFMSSSCSELWSLIRAVRAFSVLSCISVGVALIVAAIRSLWPSLVHPRFPKFIIRVCGATAAVFSLIFICIAASFLNGEHCSNTRSFKDAGYSFGPFLGLAVTGLILCPIVIVLETFVVVKYIVHEEEEHQNNNNKEHEEEEKDHQHLLHPGPSLALLFAKRKWAGPNVGINQNNYSHEELRDTAGSGVYTFKKNDPWMTSLL